MADALRVDFPEIPQIVRLYPQDGTLVEHEGETFSERSFMYVDPNFFDMFSFNLIEGDPNTVLRDPYTMVLTPETGRRYYGNKSPVGQSLTVRVDEYTITGLVEPAPGNSHFSFDFLASMAVSQQEFSRIVLENWGEMTSFTYVALSEKIRPADLEARFPAFLEKNMSEGSSEFRELFLHPLADIHLNSHTSNELGANGDITYVYAFSAIAFVVLLIACINFMNLTTARSANRAKEVGLRKVVGAYRGQLIQQFLGEVIILALIGMVLAVLLVYAVLPAFNEFVAKELTIDPAENAGMLLMFTAIVLFAGIIAGSYPAIFLSRFRPVEVLKGSLATGSGGSVLRKILVICQFSVSIFLLVVTAIVYDQLNYARSIDLGYDEEHVLVLSSPGSLRAKYQQFGNDLRTNPNIVLSAGSSRVPPGRLSSSIGTRPEGVPENDRVGMQTIWTDFDFIELLGLEIAAGRSFSRDFPSDVSGAFVINESAAARIGWTAQEAIGKGFGSSEITDWDEGQWTQRDGQVIGVVNDFHFESLHDEIVPTVYFVAPNMASNFLIRIEPGEIQETVAFIESTWQRYVPNQPFQYRFLDEAFDTLYRTEERQMTLFGIFAGLAILVGCLGLVGLASFTAQQRTKEIGVRKVLGATVPNILYLLSREFSILVLLANVIAWPMAYYVMSLWLQDFVYRVDMGVGSFAAASVLALAIAWITVSTQALRAATTDPIKALRYE
ncbi:MAG: FtsX-like permease family protein [Candidatus Latescibacteria bacterium]|nr:FtsX-like permease family protein [Candidatus Latescibacterota bacterium]